MKQISKTEAGYVPSHQRPKGDEQERENCHAFHGCAMYHEHRCDLVQGYIHSLAWCKHWTKDKGRDAA